MPAALLRADRCWRLEQRERLAVKLPSGSKMYSVGYSLPMNICCSSSIPKQLPRLAVQLLGKSVEGCPRTQHKLRPWRKTKSLCWEAADGTVNPMCHHHIIMNVCSGNETAAAVAKWN